MHDAPVETDRIYQKIARAIDFIGLHAHEQPQLETVANAVGMSPYHFQRLFADWAGLSPKRFLQVLTKEHARSLLQKSGSTFEVSDELGLSSPSRLHDLMISCEAMTPGEIKTQGAGQTLRFGWAVSPFGSMLLGWSERGVCHLSFEDDDHDHPSGSGSVPVSLQAFLPRAQWIEDTDAASVFAKRIFSGFSARGNVSQETLSDQAQLETQVPQRLNRSPYRIHLLLRGTNFQVKVWEALLRLGDRPIVSYQQLACAIGKPSAHRAVASAVASNSIAWLIPCHRVIRQHGEFGQYRWGATRKQAMLACEMLK